MTRKARSHDVLGKLSAFSMAVILLLSVFVPMFASTVEAGAANNSYNGEIYVDFSKNNTWLEYAGTNRVTINDSQIEQIGSSGLYKTKGTSFSGDTITIKYTYKKENADNRIFYKGSYSYAYFWKNGGSSDLNGAWPGMSMDEFDTNKYYCDYNSVADSVIFNDSQGGHQTGNLTIDKTNNVYDDSSDTWQAYNEDDWTKIYTATLNLSDRPGNYANTIYMDASGNVQWSRYDHSQNNPYTGTTGEEPVTVKLYAPDWTNANVLYDLADPRGNVGVEKTGTGTVEADGENYNYFTLQVPKNSKFKFYESNQNSGTGELSLPSNYNDGLYYSLVMNDWVTAENLENNEKYDILVSENNFANPSGGVSGGGSVIGVDAMYFDYLSDNERSQGWRNGLNDDHFNMDTNNYRKQFSQLNDLVQSVAQKDNSWRYPMLFGDDWNANFYINGYWNNIGTRSGSTQDYFKAVNNANFLGGDSDDMRARSVQGLVNGSLNSGKLTVGTAGTLAPYFNYDLLHNAVSGGESSEVPTNEIWIEQGINWLKRGDGVNWIDSAAQQGNLSTKIGSDGLTYYVVTQAWVGNNTHIGFNNEGGTWKTYQVSNYWGKAIWKSGDINTSISGSSGSSPYAKVISAKFPFVATKDATTGVTTYSFDSTNATDNVFFDWQNDVPTKVNYGAGSENFGIHNKYNKSGGSWGIFPFNNGSSSAHCVSSQYANIDGGYDANNKRRDYGFGIKMKTYFTLPENGVYGSESSGETTETTEIWVQTANVSRINLWNSSSNTNLTLTSLSTTTYDGHEFYRITPSIIGDYTNIGWDKDNIWQNDSSRAINDALGNAYWDTGIQAYGGVAKSTSGGSSGEHAKFEYSGDDDLWVFIDGQLVLDLGGAHMPTTGSIDFGYQPGKIKATANKVYLQVNGGDNGTTDTPQNGNKVETEFNFNNQDTSVRHEMVVYYMERGTNDSNLKVEFSIQPVTNDLRIDKTVDVSDVNSGLKDAAKAVDKFKFATSQGDNLKAVDTFGDGKGVLYNASEKGLTVGENMTIAETYSGALKYTTDSYVEDINAQQQISSTYDNGSLSFKYINAKNQTDINTSLSAHFTNKTVTKPLKVKKYLVDKNGAEITDSNIDFNFVIGVSLDGSENYSKYPLTYRLYDRNNNAVLNSDGINLYTAVDGKFKLKAGYYAQFDGIPEGAKYKITEENLLPGYTFESVTEATKGAGDYCTGSIAATGNEVVVTNKFQPIESALTAFKNLDGTPYTGDHFKFTQTLLYCSDITNVPSSDYDKYADNVDNISNGNVTFKNIQYNYVGNYFYSIRESLSSTAPTDEYVMDETIYYAMVAVTQGDNNQLQANITYYTNYDEVNHTVDEADKINNTDVVFNNRTATKYTNVSFKKQDGNGNARPGAEFTLYTDEACEKLATEENSSKSGSGFTNPAKSAENTGTVTFKQLKYEPSASGDVKATYYFKETKAPNGYQLLTGTFMIEIKGENEYVISYKESGDNEYSPLSIPYVVQNIKQPALPIAGGMGVTMFYVLGALAVVVAGTAFVLYKKRINVIALAAHLIHRK